MDRPSMRCSARAAAFDAIASFLMMISPSSSWRAGAASDHASWSLGVLATGHGGGGMSCIGLTMMVFTARALLDSGRDCCAVALVPSCCPCFWFEHFCTVSGPMGHGHEHRSVVISQAGERERERDSLRPFSQPGRKEGNLQHP